MQPWEIANTHGILVDEQAPAWHAGRVFDMLSLGSGRILVATASGGVWLIDGAFMGFPLSDDWEFPNVFCLSFGPHGGSHILAGCEGGLYETNPKVSDPLRAWHPVKLPRGVSTVYRIVISAEPPRVVLATDKSVWWATGLAGTDYQWKEAAGLKAEAPFYGLARRTNGVIAAVRGSASAISGISAGIGGAPAPTEKVSGIYVGQWDDPDVLTMKRSTISGLTQPQVDAMKYISVATCRDHLERGYAVSADSDGAVFAILRSFNGGHTWEQCSTKLEGDHDGKLDAKSMSGDQRQGGRQKTISVHPTDADVVGFGWRYALVSKNQGDSWRLMGGDWVDPNTWSFTSSHMHVDVHCLYFEPEFTNRRLYILSDGGVIQTPNWDGESRDFKSAMNRNLANLQFYSTDIKREFWGTMATAEFAPVIGGGLQDNGNVWCKLAGSFNEWTKAEGGDGGWVAFIKHAGGQLLANSMGDFVGKFGWKNDTFNWDSNVPLLTVFGNVDADGLKGPVAEAVPRPRYRNRAGELMHAVCAPAVVRAGDIMRPIPLELDGKDAESRIVFGLFGGDSTPFLYWQDIGRLPPYAGTISALGVDDGGIVYVGTQDGRIFALSVGSGPPLELTVEKPFDSPKGWISRIVTYRNDAFAVMYSGTGSYVLRLNTFTWRILRGGFELPFEPIHGLDINRMGAPVSLAAATESSVYVSPDLGDNWLQYNVGLPRMPHCSDLRFGTLEGRQKLYVSTWGRSVWMADIDAQAPSDY
jgi:hypothetical protein